ncbi:MAG: ribonuclease Z [Thermoproteus sp.]
MNMYLHIIGSGAGGSPGSKRWRSANLVEANGLLVLVDCGVGCHYRLSDRGLLTDIDYVLVTHSHMDHFLGLPEALFQAHIEGRNKAITIFAPRVVEEVIKVAAPQVLKNIRYTVNIKRIEPGLLIDLQGLKVKTSTACHNTAEEAYAFRLEADVDVLFTGDTSPRCEPIERLGSGVDVLVHEATCNEQYGDICARYAHTTTLQAMAEADVMMAETLVLTHIDEKFNPTVYVDVKKSGRPAIIAEDNMILRF